MNTSLSLRSLTAVCGFVGSLFLLTGCETSQGAVNAPRASSVGRPADEIEPAPVSKSFTQKKDVFQAAEYEHAATEQYPNARLIRMRVGEIVQVYQGSAAIGDGQDQMAFYLPPEAQSVAQLVIESRGFQRLYFLRGLAPGETVGGVVERDWLNSDHTRPKNAADEARIQNSIRGEPFLIFVE